MALLSLVVSLAAFGGVAWFAWGGRLGLAAVGLLLLAAVSFGLGRSRLVPALRKRADMVAKVLFTVVGFIALLRHPIEIEDGVQAPIYDAIVLFLPSVDVNTFVFYALCAMAVKFVGVVASAFAWHLLLVGQGVRLPFGQTILTGFLIGRFIGTFLPSTVGLDGYTLYEAGRYSNQWSRVITAKALEKFVGVTGLFLGMVLTMPFGYAVIVDVTQELGRPEAAPALAGMIVAVAGGISAVVMFGLAFPQLLLWLATAVLGVVGVKRPEAGEAGAGALARVAAVLYRFLDAVGAYRGQVGLLFGVLFAKFITHFTTAVVYFFTALAIGVVGAGFWEVTFGSTIQILATLFSPTIAGEGAREAFQALLLSKQLGGAAQAVLSGALGFIAAEAATLWGGAFLWTRTEAWRPRFATVDGEQVDYAWIGEGDGGFNPEALQGVGRP